MRNYLRLSQVLNKALIQLSRYNATFHQPVSVTQRFQCVFSFLQSRLCLACVSVLLDCDYMITYDFMIVNTFL